MSNELTAGYQAKRGSVKKKIFNDAKQWLIDVLSNNDAQQRVDKMISEAFKKEKESFVVSIVSSAAVIAEKEDKINFLIQVARAAKPPDDSKIYAEFKDKTTNPLEQYLSGILKMKGLEWKKGELAKKAKDKVSTLQKELDKPKLPKPNINPNINLHLSSPSINLNLGIPNVNYDLGTIDLTPPFTTYQLEGIDLGFDIDNGLLDWTIPIKNYFDQFDLPYYFLKEIFFDFIVDLSLSAPILSIGKSAVKLMQGGKVVISSYKEVLDTELTTEMKKNISQVHVILSDSILNHAWSLAHSKAAQYSTHIADFAASLTPAGIIANPVLSSIRFVMEVKTLAYHYLEIRAINNIVDPSARTVSGHYMITKGLIKRHSIIACSLLEKFTMYSIFGLSADTSGMIEFNSEIKTKLLQLNKKLDPVKMSALVHDVYSAYFKRLLKLSRKVVADVPYAIVTT